MPTAKSPTENTLSTERKLDIIVEKLNLSRLDTIMLSGILLPLSIVSLGLIISWVVNPPLRTMQGLNILFIIVEFMGMTFFAPLIVYAYAYVSDSINFRLMAIKSLLITLSLAGTFALFSAVETLQFFLKSKLPQYDLLLNLSAGAFVFVFVAFSVVAAFGFSWIVLSRLARWLHESIPKRVKREKIHLTPFLEPFVMVHPIMFAISASVSVVGLVAVYGFWAIAVLATSPLQDFWQEPFLMGWLFSIVPLVGFLAGIRRLNRAFARSLEERSKVAEKEFRSE